MRSWVSNLVAELWSITEGELREIRRSLVVVKGGHPCRLSRWAL